MAILLMLLLAIPLFILVLIYVKSASKNLPPGPPGLPIVGNIFQLDYLNLHICLSKLSNRYGPLMSLKLGSVPTIVISSARVAREALKTHDLNFSSRPPLVGPQTLSYDGLDLAFAPYNNYWREMRKVCVVHLFNSHRVQSFRPIREDELSRMMKKIEKISSEVDEVVNLSDLVMILTSGIICRVAFGKRYEEDGKETRRFHELLEEVEGMIGGFFFQDYLPCMKWLDKFTGMSSRLKKAFKDSDDFYQEIIDEHLDPSRRKSNIEDFMDLLIGLKKDGLFSTDLTWNHIKGVLMNVFVAGTDTGAATLVWAMTMLQMFPHVLKIAQEEIRTVIANKTFIDEEDVEKLPYLKAVVKETMRMHPTAPLLVPRYTLNKCTIDGYEIKPKTLVYINAWAIGKDSDSWENPHEFCPERFLGKSIDFKGNDFELIPFGAGRRICPGLHMGTATVELGLANLLYSFDWELPHGLKKEDIDTSAKPGITVHKRVPLCLLATKYNTNRGR